MHHIDLSTRAAENHRLGELDDEANASTLATLAARATT
jgi:hypothetical protein